MSAERLILDGHDPLSSDFGKDKGSLLKVFEESNRRVIHNIVRSYAGYYDVFSELLQNSLDALEMRKRKENGSYTPKLWITIDIPNSLIRVVDNGIGMDENGCKFCLSPHVSFKQSENLRGQKGVGASFLAYGFSFIRMQSKHESNGGLAAILRQGRQWAEDKSGTVPRPRFQAIPFDVPELLNEKSGTCMEIIIGQSPGERPKNLGWIGANSAEQWMDILRIKTPLGGIYLEKALADPPNVTLKVKSSSGSETILNTSRVEYYYPHEIPNLKVQSLRDLQKTLDSISGDSNTKFLKLDSSFKRLDALYDVWDKEELLGDNSLFASALTEEQKHLIEKHKVIIYCAFLRSAKLWTEFNDEILKVRKGTRVIQGGLQIASDYMAQGDLLIIPLTSAIGYQANTHVIVHFTDGSPDMGRKVFQPELKELASTLSVRSVTIMKRFLEHLRPDTGALTIAPDKDLQDWRKYQESYRDKNPLSLEYNGKEISLISTPQQEQDVIALFHELMGLGLFKGFKIYATSQSDRYDSLFYLEYPKVDGIHFEKKENPLGISHNFELPYMSGTMVLEYKYSFDSLVADIEKELKFTKQIDYVVCWEAGNKFKEKFYLSSLLIGDEGTSRSIFGSTHFAFPIGSQSQPAFEVLIMKDLLHWLRDPVDEEAVQKRTYCDK